jgi:hypothetical protein
MSRRLADSAIYAVTKPCPVRVQVSYRMPFTGFRDLTLDPGTRVIGFRDLSVSPDPVRTRPQRYHAMEHVLVRDLDYRDPKYAGYCLIIKRARFQDSMERVE